MKKAGVILLAALVAVFIQSAVFGTFLPRWMAPNLCLVLVVYLGIYEATPMGAALSFAVGILLDLASGQLVGPWGGAFSAVFGVLSQGGRRLFVESVFTIAVVSFISSIFASIVYLFILSQFRPSLSDMLSGVLFGTAFFTALVSPVGNPLFRPWWLKRATSRYG